MSISISSAKVAARRVAYQLREIEKSLINQGRLLAQFNRRENYDDLSDYEFKIFSQWGEDGIIQRLIDVMPGIPRQFIEFGVEDFSESNCRFLMMKDLWSGFLLDGSETNVVEIKSRHWYWRHDLTAHCAFIDKDNIAGLLERSGYFPEPGILSVDIDGVDWFVLDALRDWKPWIVIVEYNGLFGPEATVSVPYDASFVRHRKHYSGLYWGASLAAFDTLLRGRGYRLAGTNRAGSNAFFVRTDKVQGHLPEPTLAAACRPVCFRDALDERGRIQFISQRERVALIADMPLVDTVTDAELHVRDLNLA